MKLITHLPDGGVTVLLDLSAPSEPCEYTFEEWLASIGGRNLGQSQVEPNHRGNSRSSDAGVRDQT